MRIKQLKTVQDAQELEARTLEAVEESAKALGTTLAGMTWNPERMADAVNHHAELVGQARAVADFARHMTSDADFDGAAERGVKALTRRLLRGADDGWSGRTNDNRRAEFDGFRKAAESIMENL